MSLEGKNTILNKEIKELKDENADLVWKNKYLTTREADLSKRVKFLEKRIGSYERAMDRINGIACKGY